MLCVTQPSQWKKYISEKLCRALEKVDLTSTLIEVFVQCFKHSVYNANYFTESYIYIKGEHQEYCIMENRELYRYTFKEVEAYQCNLQRSCAE